VLKVFIGLVFYISFNSGQFGCPEKDASLLASVRLSPITTMAGL